MPIVTISSSSVLLQMLLETCAAAKLVSVLSNIVTRTKAVGPKGRDDSLFRQRDSLAHYHAETRSGSGSTVSIIRPTSRCIISA